MRRWLGCVLVGVLVASGGVGAVQAQTILISDNFAASSSTTAVNADLATRQAGSLATISWTSSDASGATVGYGAGKTLRFNPSAGPNIVSAGLARNFTDDPGLDGYLYMRVDITPETTGVGWFGLAVADDAFLQGWSGANSWGARQGVGMIFRGSGAFAAWSETGTVLSTTAYGAAGGHTIEVRFYDPDGGNPFDGTGDTTIALHVDGAETPHLTYTKAAPGFTTNYITFLGERDSGSPTQEMDNLEIGIDTFDLPEVAVSSSDAFAATTALGGSSTRTFTIANLGNADLTVTDIALTGIHSDQFGLAAGTCSGTSFALAAGSSCTVGVTFAPTAVGTKGATLNVSSDDSDESLVSMALSAEAVAPVPVAPIPTLSEWGMLIMGSLLLGTMLLNARKERGYRT